MKQADLPDLFDRLTGQSPQRYRTSDPETSGMAARDSERFAKGHHKKILAALEDSTEPLSAEQIAEIAGLESNVAACRRISELIDAGLIMEVDKLYRNKSGSMARRFRLRPKS